jgi:protein-S-isoprenylcysteine O-methyltransferase Ste14
VTGGRRGTSTEAAPVKSIPSVADQPFVLGVRQWLKLDIILDVVERAAVAALFGSLVYRMGLASYESGNIVYLLLTASEGAVVFFILIRRRASTVSLRPADWLTAALATTAPLLVAPSEGSPLLPASACDLAIVFGFLVQMYAKLTLRRSFGVVAANRGVKVAGPYQLIRHPMYAGYVMTHVGFLLFAPSLWNLAVYGLTFTLQIARIMAEERLLRDDPDYVAYANSVRYRIIPGLF